MRSLVLAAALAAAALPAAAQSRADRALHESLIVLDTHFDTPALFGAADHVGVSGDFDGGGGVADFNDVTDVPKITAALRAAGYSRQDIAKVWGGNALRVFRAAQAGRGS